MESVETLPHTTFSGRRFTRKQLLQVQGTVEMFSGLSRTELAETICEHLKWFTPKGTNKIPSCLVMLEKLETYGVIKLPVKEARRSWQRQVPSPPRNRAEEIPVDMFLEQLGPIELRCVITQEDRHIWQSYLGAYHYLGYKHPVGAHIGYLIMAPQSETLLGCLLLTSSAAWALNPRDRFIGWTASEREKGLHLILSNNRFLVLPWIHVPHLASKVLSQMVAQVGDDWLKMHGYRPVLIETFVDQSQYTGTCYRAANWQHVGETTGRAHFRSASEQENTKKHIFVMPLRPDWRACLQTSKTKETRKRQYRNDMKASHSRIVDDGFVALWEKVVHLFREVAETYDEKWQVRKRVLDTLVLMLLIFRLVSSKNTQSYGTTIDELWDSCDHLELALPQRSAVMPSSFCEARKKLDAQAFYDLNQKILAAYAPHHTQEAHNLWQGHRLFAVDGTKINLPRNLVKSGYRVPSNNAHYPQGLVSCLYALKPKLPMDFELVTHNNERLCAQKHLHTLEKDDVVVYDRGYFSYALLHQHMNLGIHGVFRLQEHSFAVIKAFWASGETDRVVTIHLEGQTKDRIEKSHPDLEIHPIFLRLLKYTIGNDIFCLGTTLVDTERYPISLFPDVYHARWGLEEFFKTSKRLIQVEDFHGKSERGVKQELYAHFALLSMNRIFANQVEAEHNPDLTKRGQTTSDSNTKKASGLHRMQVNTKNALHAFVGHLEPLLLLHRRWTQTIADVCQQMARQIYKKRLGRSYERKSMRPESKWRPSKEAKLRKKKPLAPMLSHA